VRKMVRGPALSTSRTPRRGTRTARTRARISFKPCADLTGRGPPHESPVAEPAAAADAFGAAEPPVVRRHAIAMNRLVFSVLFLLADEPVAQVQFPGPAHAPDPSGRYDVVYRELPTEAPENRHELSLRDTAGGQQRRLLTFGRSAAVLWAPDGNAVAITNWLGSNVSEVTVFFSAGTPHPIDIDDELSRAFGALPERYQNDHVYVEAVRWLSARTLRFRLWGHGDHNPKGFNELFDFPLAEKPRRAVRASSR
jgi:hypothetical protein